MTNAAEGSLTVTFERARPTCEIGLGLKLGSLTWAGPLVDDDEVAATRRYRLEVGEASPAESDVLDWLRRILPRIPLPPHGYRRLADRLFRDHATRAHAWLEGREDVDACLVRALVERRPDGATGPRVRMEQRPLLVLADADEMLMEASLRPDASVVAITHRRSEGYRVYLDVDGRRCTLDVPSAYGRPMALRALGASTIRPPTSDDDLELVAYDHDAKICTVFPEWRRGDLSRALRFALGRPPMHAFHAEGRLFVQCPSESVGVREDVDAEHDETATVRIPHFGNRSMASEHPMRFGRFITGTLSFRFRSDGPEVSTLAWFDLRDELEPVPTGAAPCPTAMVRYRDELWALSTGVLHRIRPGEAARDVVKGNFVSLSVNEAAVWVGEIYGGGHRIVRLAHDDCARLTSVEISIYPSSMVSIADGVLVLGSLAFAHVRGDGTLGAQSASRRIAAFARARDGSVVACAGEELLFLGPDGSTRRKRLMPYDGAISGTLGEYFLFAPCGSGWQRSTPDALHLLDTNGAAVGRLSLDGPDAPYLRSEYRWDDERFVHRGNGDARAALLNAAGGRQLVALTPGPVTSADEIRTLDDERLVWTLPTRNGETVVRSPICNPRDDFPEPGVSVQGAAILLRGNKYDGTPDSSAGPAIEARDGALVVLEDCDLGSGGITITGEASVILIGCRIGTSKAVSTGPQGRIFRYDVLAGE